MKRLLVAIFWLSFAIRCAFSFSIVLFRSLSFFLHLPSLLISHSRRISDIYKTTKGGKSAAPNNTFCLSVLTAAASGDCRIPPFPTEFNSRSLSLSRWQMSLLDRRRHPNKIISFPIPLKISFPRVSYVYILANTGHAMLFPCCILLIASVS